VGAIGKVAGRSTASEGRRLLVAAARTHRIRLVGRPLADQAAVADGLLACGVLTEEIRAALARPFLEEDGTPVDSTAAVVAYRLRELAGTGAAAPVLPSPRQGSQRWLTWCQQCHQGTRVVEVEEEDGEVRPKRCPACHPFLTGVYF
jgi:hypothetical protein